jgi:hypothetical protein
MERFRKALDGFYAFLSRPLYMWARPVLLALAIPLLLAAILPLWRFEVDTPQFPAGLSVDVYAYTIHGGHNEADLRDLNALSHYIGMKRIDPAALDDLDWLPFGFGALGVLLLRVAAIGNVRALIDLSVITTYFALFSGARFVFGLHARGMHLSADAPIKVDPFMPPLFGGRQVGAIMTYARPGVGAWMLALFVISIAALAIVHLALGRRRARLEVQESANA